MKSESSTELKRLFKETFNSLDGLGSLDRGAHKSEDLVIFLTTSRFDPITRREWERQLGSEPPTLAELRKFAKLQILTLESIEGRSKSNLNQAKVKEKSVAVHVAQATNKSKTKQSQIWNCAICKQEHFTSACKILHGKDAAERKALAIPKNLCSNCLGTHSINECKSTRLCSTCNGKHHSLLHEAYASKGPNSNFKFNPNAALYTAEGSKGDTLKGYYYLQPE